jgi:cytochrome b6-f complex iron-sulfur subunit
MNQVDPAGDGMGRRDFLARLWRILGGVALLEAAGLVGAFLWPRRRAEEESGHGVIDTGPVAEFTPGSVTAFPAGRFYLVRLQDGGFLALSSICSHLECSVPWNPKDGRFVCPCHGSVFELTGAVLNPPAPRPLDLYAVAIEGGIVRVDTRRRIRRQRFESSQVTRL